MRKSFEKPGKAPSRPAGAQRRTVSVESELHIKFKILMVSPQATLVVIIIKFYIRS